MGDDVTVASEPARGPCNQTSWRIGFRGDLDRRRPARQQQTYLRVAEIVLADALQPLKAREIVDRGIERGLFGDHVLSCTPEKSMQARLSTDILNRASAKLWYVPNFRRAICESLRPLPVAQQIQELTA